MDINVNGIVVAASEIIRFERGYGILLTLYNTYMDFHFYVVILGNSLKLWKRISVTHFYKFLCLKVGIVQWLSGTKFVVLLTTSKSTFCEIAENQLEEFRISNDLVEKISIPSIIFKAENSVSKLISYKGIVTKVKHSKLGLYELDNKIHLYCIFNSFSSTLMSLKEGLEIFASNVHFLKDFKARLILVCCGLSSIRPVEHEDSLEGNDNGLFPVYYDHYPLSIFDVIWLENLLLELNVKFCPSIISDDSCFHWESKIINNILEYFSCSLMEASHSYRQSLGSEYCSYPHTCCAFSGDILPTGCDILLISDILKNASDKLVWTENSINWKTCTVMNETKCILIGMLYLSKNGCWYIADKSCCVPIIFTKSCSACSSTKSLLCSFNDLNLGYLIALQKFDIIFEKIRLRNENYSCYRYFRASCCHLFYIGTYYKEKGVFSYASFLQENIHIWPEDNIIHEYVDKLSEKSETTHIFKQDLLMNVEMFSSLSLNKSSEIENITNLYVLVLNKIWTFVDQAFICNQILVFLLPQEESYSNSLNNSESFNDKFCRKSDSFNDDSFEFYETDADLDFAELISSLDSLYLEEKQKLAKLHFESTRQCATLLPGHIYNINCASNIIKEINSIHLHENNSKLYLIKIKPSMKITHCPECLGNHYSDDYNIDIYHSIKQIISEKKVRENCVIRAILMDKLYEEDNISCSSQTSVDKGITFCLIVKDVITHDTIKLYLPYCPKNMFGLLPGLTLQMHGFVCRCSKKGHLYLTSSSSFSIQILNSHALYHLDESSIMQSDEENLKLIHLRSIPTSTCFKCLCYIIKIISAKLCLICNSCTKPFSEKCSCLCNYSTKLTISFIIDDGTSQVLARSSDEIAKKILMFSEEEWCGLVTGVTKSLEDLKFYHKMAEDDLNSSTLLNRVFCVYCSSKFLCRRVLLKCRNFKNFGVSKRDESSVWCCDVLKICSTDLIPELIIKYKNIKVQD